MAKETKQSTAPTSHPVAGARRWKYGANVAVLIAIVLTAIVLLNYAVNAANIAPRDLTGAGSFSLSPQSKGLLDEIKPAGDGYLVYSTFHRLPTGSEQDQEQALEPKERNRIDNQRRENYDALESLLDAYHNYDPKIERYPTTNATAEDVELQIRDRLADQIRPYAEAVGRFGKLRTELNQFARQQSAIAGLKAQARGVSEDDQAAFQSFSAEYGKRLPAVLDSLERSIKHQTDATLPKWSSVTDNLKAILDKLSTELAAADKAQNDPGYGPVFKAYLKEESAAFKKMVADMKAYRDTLDKLPALDVADVESAFSRPDTLIIFAPKAVKVIDRDDIIKTNPGDPNSPNAVPQETFQGEQAISSALLALARPDKPKVVFVGGTAPPRSQISYNSIKDRLRKANYDVLDWTPPGAAPQSPDQPPPPATDPPAVGTQKANGREMPVVWVVFPPDQPDQQMMMMGMPPPNPQPLIDAVKKHLAQGGAALFLAENAGPSFGPGPGGYAFAELVKPFGIDVKANLGVVQLNAMRGGDTAEIPQLLMDHYPDHPITTPLQSLQTLFVGVPTQMGFMGDPTVVDVAADKPSDVSAAVIVESPNSGDIFATPTPSPTGKFNSATDRAAPVPLAVASEKGAKGGAPGQRVVVIGNRYMAVDPIVDQSQTYQINGELVQVPAYPGNAELLANSVYWLSHNSNMIAVSPKAEVGARIRSMEPGTTRFVKTVAGIGPPLFALAAGVMMFIIRRR